VRMGDRRWEMGDREGVKIKIKIRMKMKGGLKGKVTSDRILFEKRRFNMGWGVILLKESHEGTGYVEKAYG